MVGCWWWLSLFVPISVFRDVSELFRERISVESRMKANPHPDNNQLWIGGMFTWWSWLILPYLSMDSIYDILEMWFRSFTYPHIHWSLPIESGPSLTLVVIVVGWVVVGWLDGTEVQFLGSLQTVMCIYVYHHHHHCAVVWVGSWYQCMVYPSTKSNSVFEIWCYRYIFCCASIWSNVAAKSRNTDTRLRSFPTSTTLFRVFRSVEEDWHDSWWDLRIPPLFGSCERFWSLLLFHRPQPTHVVSYYTRI